MCHSSRPLAALLPLLILACAEEGQFPMEQTETSLAPIIGGLVDTGHPAVGALVGNALCTATLITPKLVLTAAHCFQGYQFDYFKLGPSIDNPTQAISLQSCIKHPNYGKQNVGGVNQPVHDLAICVLNQKVNGITPAVLRKANLEAAEKQSVTFVGYGATSSSGSGKGSKMKVQVTIDSVTSNGFWNLVQGSPVKNTCIGDSGGPGFVANGGQEELAGVVSAGDYYCTQNGWNMRVDMELAWIKQTVDQYDPGAISFGTCPDGSCNGSETSATCPADCGESGSDLWKPCSTPYDCNDQYVCAQFSFGDFCTLECPSPGSAGTCPAPYVCSPVSGGGGVCTPGSGGKCGNGNCDMGENGTTCAIDCNAKLWDQCPSVNLCGPGLFCIGWKDGTNRCTQDCPTPNSTTGCPSGYICYPLDGESGGACAPDANAPKLCGNGVCDAGEQNQACPEDCSGGVCGAVGPEGCCDGTVRTWCEFGALQMEGCGTQGCGWSVADNRYLCGFDGTDPDGNLPRSCGDIATPTCGNSECETGESSSTCPQDCGPGGPVCGDGVCVNVEGCTLCPEDCGPCEDALEEEQDITDQEIGQAPQEPSGGQSGGCSLSHGVVPTPGIFLLFALLLVAIVSRRWVV